MYVCQQSYKSELKSFHTHTQQRSKAGDDDGDDSSSLLARIVALSVTVDPTAQDDLQSFISQYAFHSFSDAHTFHNVF